ncbi:hypothetical protein E2C01_085490 [Portunus trituberculatus]|uniref:Secreted protein n=1 Tax=Portunus trituberculatus TaxID=210409 RepID=A0A5B7IY87_PORTR|nr:hypothetical protein [Portunus trituberculatus]
MLRLMLLSGWILHYHYATTLPRAPPCQCLTPSRPCRHLPLVKTRQQNMEYRLGPAECRRVLCNATPHSQSGLPPPCSFRPSDQHPTTPLVFPPLPQHTL